MLEDGALFAEMVLILPKLKLCVGSLGSQTQARLKCFPTTISLGASFLPLAGSTTWTAMELKPT